MIQVGGAPIVTLRQAGEGIVEAQVAPGRGMLLLQAHARRTAGDAAFPILASPPLEALPAALDQATDDFAGNASFSLGGAVLLPYANRITGRALEATREILAQIDGAPVRLPRNWGGKASGATHYAMHGLTLSTPFQVEQPDSATLVGRLRNWNFGGYWRGRADIEIRWRLTSGGLELGVEVLNSGDEAFPVGIGWHPWFVFPSANRSQAQLSLPARSRLAVNDYDEVLPTGELRPVPGTPYDFRRGAALGDLYLDDCFVELDRTPSGDVVLEARDPAAGYGVRLATSSPGVRAIQVYAPPDRPLVALEPQFNWADPYGEVWPPETDTGMVRLAPGQSTTYKVRTEVLDLRQA